MVWVLRFTTTAMLCSMWAGFLPASPSGAFQFNKISRCKRSRKDSGGEPTWPQQVRAIDGMMNLYHTSNARHLRNGESYKTLRSSYRLLKRRREKTTSNIHYSRFATLSWVRFHAIRGDSSSFASSSVLHCHDATAHVANKLFRALPDSPNSTVSALIYESIRGTSQGNWYTKKTLTSTKLQGVTIFCLY